MKNNSRLIVVQKIYEKIQNFDEPIIFPKNSYIRVIKKVFHGFFEKDKELDLILVKNLAQKVSFSNLDMILKIILKSAIYEIYFLPKIPFKVVIDEYLTVTEMYYDNKQKSLVNAVLDSVFKNKSL